MKRTVKMKKAAKSKRAAMKKRMGGIDVTAVPYDGISSRDTLPYLPR